MLKKVRLIFSRPFLRSVPQLNAPIATASNTNIQARIKSHMFFKPGIPQLIRHQFCIAHTEGFNIRMVMSKNLIIDFSPFYRGF